MSWNSRRNWRNPVVEELARLLAIVSRFNCCALMPLAAVYRARIMFFLVSEEIAGSFSYFGQILGGDLVEFGVEDGERLLHHLRLALHHDQVQRALDDILVGGLDGALVDRCLL